MFTLSLQIAAVVIALAFGSGGAFAQGPNLGKPIAPADLAAWDISIMPDGSGLPPGSGTPAQGVPIYAQKCAACHGARNLVNALGFTGSCRAAGAQVLPPSAETITFEIRPFPEYATPEIS